MLHDNVEAIKFQQIHFIKSSTNIVDTTDFYN